MGVDSFCGDGWEGGAGSSGYRVVEGGGLEDAYPLFASQEFAVKVERRGVSFRPEDSFVCGSEASSGPAED